MQRKDIFWHTKRKIIILSTAIVFLCLLIFALILQGFFTARLFKNIDYELLKQKRMLQNAPPIVMENNSRLFKPEGKLVPPGFPPNLIVFVYEGENLLFKNPNAYFGNNQYPSFPANANGEIVMWNEGGYNFRGLSFGQENLQFQIIANIDSELRSVKQLMHAIIVSSIALIIIAALFSALLASRVIKPVKKAYDKQILFVQDASHEMRTPLAIIKGKLELLTAARDDTIDTHFEPISQMMSEIRGLEKLNHDLLLLTKADIDSSIVFTKFKLDSFSEDLSSFYLDLAELQNKKFQVIKPEKQISVVWDYNKMKRSVIILLENAFKYTPTGGNITLKLEDVDKNIKISVIDTGIGIKFEDQERIFDRFFRSANVRGTTITGSGIGLSLLKSFSHTLGFKISLSSEYQKGTIFSLMIPKIMK